jgi:hypothetical protein
MGNGFDRRHQPRSEVVGHLWGSLGALLRLPLQDISREGILVGTSQPLPLRSTHQMRVVWSGLDVEVEVRVVRLQRSAGPGGRDWHLMALEFVRTPPVLARRIARMVEQEDTGGSRRDA